MNLGVIISECQAAVGATVDGQPGLETWTKIHNRLVPTARPIAVPPVIDRVGDRADERSEKAIATLLPEVQPYARALVHRAADRGITIKIISGTRTYEEQDALYHQRPPVTKARGGYSNHNFGIAFDVGVFSGAKYLAESPLYKVVGVLGTELGLEWGGNWKTFVDEPHFQFRPAWAVGMSESAMLAELRARRSNGKPLFS